MRSSVLLKRVTLEHVGPTFRTRPTYLLQASISNKEQPIAVSSEGLRSFSMTIRLLKDRTKRDFVNQAKELGKKSQELQDEVSMKRDGQIDDTIGEAEEKQARTPWHREGSDQSPVRRMRSAGVMTKGIPYVHLVTINVPGVSQMSTYSKSLERYPERTMAH
jgi:hypothetical protein